MRHVIVGSDTVIGSSIVRLLGSIKADNIIAVSRSGMIPEGVDPKIVEPKFGDVIDLYILNDIFQEDDIIYHCQIVSDERSSKEEAELINKIGFQNLLGIASLSKVQKIVIAFPQALGYDLPKTADENELGKTVSPIQKTLRNARETALNYINDESFGWAKTNIAKFAKQAEEAELRRKEQEAQEKAKEDADTSNEEDTDSDSSNGGSSSGPSMPSSGPSLGGSSSGPSMPSSGPSLGGSSTDGSVSNLDDVNNSSELELSDTDKVNDDSPSEEEVDTFEDEQLHELKLDRVPLILARLGRIFGPFDPDLTSQYCKGVRLQRMEVFGEIDYQISWINPIDGARAMIILGDPKTEIKPGEFLVNGFNASPREILKTLDKINHSTIDLTINPITKERYKHYLKSIVSKLGFKVEDNYYHYLSFNRRQVFNDYKVRNAIGWEPNYGLKRTAKDAFNWFSSHQI